MSVNLQTGELMAKTSIEWTDFSINPIRARWKPGSFKPSWSEKGFISSTGGHYCEKVSPGCKFCYASRMQPRFGMPTFNEAIARRDDIEVYLDESKLQQVLCRKKPTKYFWCDLTDMFGDWVCDEWIGKCFATMFATPQHIHQVLTKRAERMQAYVSRLAISLELPNVWFGVSAENQQYADERIPLLLQTPAAVRFVSYEPALGPINFERFGYVGADINWVIAGGESGPGARPSHPEWFRSIRDQCEAAGVAYFMKQITERGKKIPFEQWPADLQVRQFPGVCSVQGFAAGKRVVE